MTKSKAVIALCSVIALGGVQATVRAADAPKAAPAVVVTQVVKDATVKGVIAVTKDEQGHLTSCELKSENGITYLCDPVSQWRLLARNNGKLVELTGVTSLRNGVPHLHVKSLAYPKP